MLVAKSTRKNGEMHEICMLTMSDSELIVLPIDAKAPRMADISYITRGQSYIKSGLKQRNQRTITLMHASNLSAS